MKLIESVKAVPRIRVVAVLKPVASFFGGAILAGSQILGEDSLLTAALVAALPSTCGFSALLGALLTAVFAEITASRVASLATAMVALLTHLLFDGTSKRRYPLIVSAVSAISYLGCAIFAGTIASATVADYIRIISTGTVLAVATYLTTTVSRTGIFSATKPQLLVLYAFAVMVASSYHLGEILSFLVCVICVWKLTRDKSTLSASSHSSSLRLSFLSDALGHFPKFGSSGQKEQSFGNMVELLSLTESEISEGLQPTKSKTDCGLICELLSKKIGTEVSGNPLPDGAIELFFPKSARISENAIVKTAEKAGMRDGIELFRSETDSIVRFTLTPKPKYHFEAGICQMAANRDSSDGICGDSAEIWSFGTQSHLILSDGMGTGREAGKTARNLIKAFKTLTEAGYSLESSLRLSNEYIRSCQPEESFATLDILSVNLMTGEVRIRKCGAGKSYIFKDGGVTPIPQGGYPIGILEEISLVNTEITPSSDITIIMMTDGADSIGLEKLAEISIEQDKLSPDDLAALITSEASKSYRHDSRDDNSDDYRNDITVAAVRIAKY